MKRLLVVLALLFSACRPDVAPELPEPTPKKRKAPKPTPTPTATPSPTSVPEPWGALSDCESGLRNRAGRPIEGSRRWNLDVGLHDGGLQFNPATWRGFGGVEFAPAAHLASKWDQVKVAKRVLAKQGWGAWPNCSRIIGVRS